MERCRISTGVKGAQSTTGNELCIIIDVLRASSTIVTALAHGVEEILIVTSIADALKIKKRGYTTAGERECVKIPGFDLGNSPLEFLNAIKNRPIKKMVVTTSNLTRVLAHCETAYICSSLNLTAVGTLIKGEKVNIVAAGGPRGVVEDMSIAFALVMRLHAVKLHQELIQKMITQSLAAQHLTAIGYGGDVKFITHIDKYKVVPLYRKGVITCFE